MSTQDEIVVHVSVRQNLVVAIRRTPRTTVGDETVYDDRLAVATALSQNNLSNGCFDGDYFLEDFETARHFAALCLGYMKNLCETSLEAINDFALGSGADWVNPHLPVSNRQD